MSVMIASDISSARYIWLNPLSSTLYRLVMAALCQAKISSKGWNSFSNFSLRFPCQV